LFLRITNLKKIEFFFFIKKNKKRKYTIIKIKEGAYLKTNKTNVLKRLIMNLLILSSLSGTMNVLVCAETVGLEANNENNQTNILETNKFTQKQKDTSTVKDIQKRNTQSQIVNPKQQVTELANSDQTNVFCTVDPYFFGDVYMIGTYKGSFKQFKLHVGHKEYTLGFKQLPNNQFKIYIGNKIPPSISSVTLKSFDEKGRETSSNTISIQEPKLTINRYTLGDSYINGEFIGDVAQFKLTVGMIGSVKEYTPGFKRLANNQFEVYAKDKILRGSIRVVLVALNSEGTVLKSDLVRVQAPFIVSNSYKLGNEYITGTYAGNVKKFKLIVDGKEYFPGFKLLAGNRFEVYAKNKVSKETQTITLISFDEQGKEMASEKVVLVNPAVKENSKT
jgi:hypothetical protein